MHREQELEDMPKYEALSVHDREVMILQENRVLSKRRIFGVLWIGMVHVWYMKGIRC